MLVFSDFVMLRLRRRWCSGTGGGRTELLLATQRP